MQTTNEQKPVLLVARDSNGKEVARQVVKDESTANKLMVARNRPLGRDVNFPKWGIECEVTK